MNQQGYIRLPPSAEYLGIAPRTLRAWVKRHLVKCYRPTSRLLLFRQADLDEAMQRFSTGGRT
jgi:excisionase family DNA binding protein